MTQKSVESKGKILEGLGALIRGTGAAQAATPVAAPQKSIQFQDSARDLSSAVESLKSKIEMRRSEAAAKSGAGSKSANSETVAARVGPTRQELQKVQLEQAVRSLRSTIAALHSKLRTGFSENSLQELQGSMLGLAKESGGVELDARIRMAVIERVNHELGPVAWNVLMNLMERAKMQWPEPGGKKRADYGEALIQSLSADLTARFGKGIGYVNITQMRRFHLLWLASNLQTTSEDSFLESIQRQISRCRPENLRYRFSSSVMWDGTLLRCQ